MSDYRIGEREIVSLMERNYYPKKRKESEIIIYEDNNINDSIITMISYRLILIHYHRA